MKKRIIIIVSILLVILGGLLIIIYNINKSNKIKNENMEIISSSYQDLSINVSDYNEIRMEYLKLSSDFFYETFTLDKDKYEEIVLNEENDEKILAEGQSNPNMVDKQYSRMILMGIVLVIIWIVLIISYKEKSNMET